MFSNERIEMGKWKIYINVNLKIVWEWNFQRSRAEKQTIMVTKKGPQRKKVTEAIINIFSY